MSVSRPDQSLRLLPSLPLKLEIQSFTADCRARGLSPKTIHIYTTNLRGLQDWIQCQDAADITPNQLPGYLIHLQDVGHNPGGVHQVFRVLRTFFRWLVAEEVLEKNPMERIRPPRLANNPLPPLHLDVLEAMLATCDKSFIGIRDRPLLMALLDTGCRASEFVALNLSDANLSSGVVIVRHGKGQKQRVLFLGAKSRRALARYLRYRRDAEPNHPLWVTMYGTRLKYSGLRQIVRRRAAAANVDEPSLHSFRRAFALLSLRGGMDICSLQKLMGHSDLSVLRRYLAQTEDDLASAHEKAGPVDNLL